MTQRLGVRPRVTFTLLPICLSDARSLILLPSLLARTTARGEPGDIKGGSNRTTLALLVILIALV
jgi:hypothetical protein